MSGAPRPPAKRLAIVLAGCALLTGIPRSARAEPGDDLRISVLTFGPGDHPFARFGHNAVVVRSTTPKETKVYNYGTYEFSSPTLVRDFLASRPRYWLSVSTLSSTIVSYRAQNRSITEQELALSPAQRQRIAARLAHDALPENKHYLYDYYLDNCSTRVRDVVDEVLGGRLHDATRGPARLTYRGHTARLVADQLPIFLGLDLALGGAVDRPITEWDETFLPESLAAGLRKVRLATPAGEAPAVSRESRLFVAERPPLPSDPPNRIPFLGFVGSLIGGTLALLGYLGRSRLAARITFAALLSILGLVTGLLGSLLAYLWLATDHVVAHRNENLFQLSPLGLLVVPLALWAATGAPRGRGWLERALSAAAMLALAGALLQLLPGFDQVNGNIVALALPIWLGAAVGAHGGWKKDTPLG